MQYNMKFKNNNFYVHVIKIQKFKKNRKNSYLKGIPQ